MFWTVFYVCTLNNVVAAEKWHPTLVYFNVCLLFSVFPIKFIATSVILSEKWRYENKTLDSGDLQ